VLLDRYPLFYVDEGYYNFPAVSYLRGEGYCCLLTSDTPHGNLLWAINGPFFSRLQAVTFSLVGPSLGAARLPEFTAAFLAIGLLCGVLAARGLPVAGVALAVLWTGDRSLLESMNGRPDGLSLLGLAIGFVFLLRTARTGAVAPAVGCGAGIGMACGFHFGSAYFVLATGLALVLLVPQGRRVRAVAAYAGGGLIAVGVILIMWWPDIPEAVEQVLWHIGLSSPDDYCERLFRLVGVLRWSRYWAIALVAFWFVVGAVAVRRRIGSGTGDPVTQVLVATTLFGAAGLACVLSKRTLLPYYLIFFTPWAMLGLVTWLGCGWKGGRRVIPITVAVLAFTAWVPSLGWNLLRLREAVLSSGDLKREVRTDTLRRAIPPGATVSTTPELLIPAVEAGFRVVPLPFYPEPFRPADDAFLVLDEAQAHAPTHVHPDVLVGRRVVYRGGVYPGVLTCRIVIYSPVAPPVVIGSGR
jgi:hypothetical protein